MVISCPLNAAVYLRLAFGGRTLTGTDGLPILEEHEVLIHTDERDECEALLRENCRAEARWYSVILIHTRSQAAWLAFDEAYRAVVSETPLAATLRYSL